MPCFAQNICTNLPAGAVAGDFELSGNVYTGCSPFNTTVVDKSGGTDIRYDFYYTNKTPAQLDKIGNLSPSNAYFVSTATSIYTILQYGKKNGQDMYACKNVTVRPNNQPVFSNSACNELLEVIIDNVKANDFDFYQIDWGDGKFTDIPSGFQLPIIQRHNYSFPAPSRTIRVEGFYVSPNTCPRATTKNVPMDGGTNYPNISSIELSNDKKTAILTLTGALSMYDLYQRSASGTYENGKIDMKIKPGIYKVNLVDTTQSCFKVFRNFGCREGSGEVCTTDFDLTAKGKENIIKWQNHPSGVISSTYDVQVVTKSVNTSIIRSLNSPLLISNPGNPHNDPVECTKEFCYQVQNIVKGTIDYGRFSYESISKSPIRCIDRKNIRPDGITESIVTVNENSKINIKVIDNSKWDLKREYYILFRENASDFAKIDSSRNLVFEDNKIDATEKSICYKIGFVDECGSNSLLSPKLCSINLKESESNISWSFFSPFGSKIVDKFNVQWFESASSDFKTSYTENGNKFLNSPDLSKFDDEVKFRIEAISDLGYTSYSNVIVIPIKANFFFPTAFSPDNDNLNDVFQLNGNLNRIKDYSLKIFDRWGSQLLELKDKYSFWDGKVNGKNLQAGLYFFKLNLLLSNGEKIEKRAEIELLR